VHRRKDGQPAEGGEVDQGASADQQAGEVAEIGTGERVAVAA
jgi:hypothetical protein